MLKFGSVIKTAGQLFFAKQPPKISEIMGRVATVFNDITRGYIPKDYPLPSQDPILRDRAGGSTYNLDIYRRVQRDDRVKACFQQRGLALSARHWEVVAGGADNDSIKAAAFVRSQVAKLGMSNLCREEEMGEAIAIGYSVGEIYWEDISWGDEDYPTQEYIGVSQIQPERQERFGFDADGNLRLRTLQNTMGEVVPRDRFWVVKHGGKSDPNGLGLCYWLYFPTLFKTQGWKFWLTFADQYGNPTKVGKYPANLDINDPKVQTLKLALQSFSQNTGIVIPDGMVVELLEATRSGSVSTYQDMILFLDRAIASLIVGQSFSVDGAGGQYKGDNLMDVRKELVIADAEMLGSSFNRDVIKPLFEWNLQNFPMAAQPFFRWVMEDDEDLSARAARDEKLFHQGYRLTPQKVTEIYGDGYELIAQPTVPQGTPQPPQFASVIRGGELYEFADRQKPEPDNVDLLAKQLADKARTELGTMMSTIREALDGASDITEFRDSLDTLYPDLDGEQLTKLMAEAMFASKLSGIFEAERGD